MLLRPLRRALPALALPALVAACASPPDLVGTVEGYGIGAEELASYRAFTQLEREGEGALRDRALFELVRKELEARGYEYRGAGEPRQDDAFGVSVRGTVESQSEYVPPSTVYRQDYHHGYLDRYPIADEDGGIRYVSVYRPGHWTRVPVIQGGYTQTIHHRRLDVDFRAPSGRLLWEGEVRSSGERGDLVAVMRAFVPLLMEEFPEPSGRPRDHVVPWPQREEGAGKRPPPEDPSEG